MQVRWRVAKNAGANLIRGGASGAVAIFLPAVLVRHMSQLNYSVWVLVLQVGAYSSYLEFGLQTAVGRYIAIADENRDRVQRDTIFSTAFAGLSIAAALAIILLVAATLGAATLFPAVPATLLPQAQCALLMVGVSLALGLPSSAWTAVFVGLQRNELVAAVTVAAKLLSAIGLVFAVLRGASLVEMAAVVSAVNLASYLFLCLLGKRFSAIALRLGLVTKSAAKELFGYCFGLSIWSFAMMLINGLDLILVGRFELGALAPYAVASTLVTFIAGMHGAIISATMPHAAVLHARQDSAGIGRVVVSATRLGVLLLALTGMPLLIYARPLLQIWVGGRYAAQTYVPLAILLIANIIRLTGLPYATAVAATGQQRLVITSPLLEGLSNLLASVMLGMKFGAIGVAMGTLIGAVVGMFGHIFYNMPRTRKKILLSTHHFIVAAICLPAMATLPLLALAAYSWKRTTTTPSTFAIALAASLFLCAAAMFATESPRRTA
jgi:O-antigen/teichoic acid export membrane protein